MLFNFQGEISESVLQTQRVHPFPFRTRKLSSAVAKILHGRLCGKIAQCRHSGNPLTVSVRSIRIRQSEHGGVAQLGEHLPCKQGVMGSNPIISTTRKGRRKSELESPPSSDIGS